MPSFCCLNCCVFEEDAFSVGWEEFFLRYKLPDHSIIFARWRQQHKNGRVTLGFATHFYYIKQSYHFATNFDRVLLQLVEILNILFTYWVGSWHSSLKRLNSWQTAVRLICYLWIFSMCNCMFTWKDKLYNLKCCRPICWTISVVSMKFAGYVAWILTYEVESLV